MKVAGERVPGAPSSGQVPSQSHAYRRTGNECVAFKRGRKQIIYDDTIQTSGHILSPIKQLQRILGLSLLIFMHRVVGERPRALLTVTLWLRMHLVRVRVVARE